MIKVSFNKQDVKCLECGKNGSENLKIIKGINAETGEISDKVVLKCSCGALLFMKATVNGDAPRFDTWGENK